MLQFLNYGWLLKLKHTVWMNTIALKLRTHVHQPSTKHSNLHVWLKFKRSNKNTYQPFFLHRLNDIKHIPIIYGLLSCIVSFYVLWMHHALQLQLWEVTLHISRVWLNHSYKEQLGSYQPSTFHPLLTSVQVCQWLVPQSTNG